MNVRLLRYARYQVMEFVSHRLALPLVLIAFIGALPAYMMTRNVPAGFMQSGQGIMLAKQLFQSITLYLPLGAFVGAVGVISADRQQGYFRFLFSKPVNVLAYYAQAYLLHALVFVASFGLIVWTYGAYTTHFSVHRSMEAAALTFLLIGGLGLLFGALTKFDATLLIIVYVLAFILQQLMSMPNGPANGGLPGWLATIGKALPPAVGLDHLRDALYAGQSIDMAQFWHVAGYGSGAAIVGFLLLRRLPLAR